MTVVGSSLIGYNLTELQFSSPNGYAVPAWLDQIFNVTATTEHEHSPDRHHFVGDFQINFHARRAGAQQRMKITPAPHVTPRCHELAMKPRKLLVAPLRCNTSPGALRHFRVNQHSWTRIFRPQPQPDKRRLRPLK